MYKSLHAKLRWPVSHVIPEYAYRVSALSQKSRDHLTYGDLYALNDLVEDVKNSVEAGLTGKYYFKELTI